VRRLEAHETLARLEGQPLEELRRATDEFNKLVRRLHVERHQAPALRMAEHRDEVLTSLANVRQAIHGSLRALAARGPGPARATAAELGGGAS